MSLSMTTLEELAPYIRIFAHPLRLRILDFLASTSTPQRVTEIVEVSEGAQQAIVSQQLKIMREQGVLQTERRGNCIYYSIKSEESLALLDCIRKFESE